MDSTVPEPSHGDWIHAGENLRRHKTSGTYYAFAKRGRKQFRRSLHTTDKATAKRLKDDFMHELDRLVDANAAQITFDELAVRWIESERHTLKESSARRRAGCIKSIAPAFLGLQIRNITASHCDAWAKDRVKNVSAATFVKELETMRGAFRYAAALGLIIRDPSSNIKRPKVRNRPPEVPTREQFKNIVAEIRAEPQGKGKDGADLVELLAYSGMRLNEALSLRWQDVNFSQGYFTVTGGERGTKNYEHRVVQISEALLILLTKIKRDRDAVSPGSLIIKTATARQCLQTACRKLGYPNFHHHSLRHFFATCAVESGAQFTDISDWLGHRDGGALLMKRYRHHRLDHSKEQMKRVNFDPVTNVN